MKYLSMARRIAFLLLCSSLIFVGLIYLTFTLLIPEDIVLESLPKYSEKEYYSSGGFQDTTDYAKYTYLISEEDLQNNEYLLPVESTDLPQIIA